MSFLSKEAREELQEAVAEMRKAEAMSIDSVIDEAISEEVSSERALEAVVILEDVSLPGPSTSGVKRPGVDGGADDGNSSGEEFQSPPERRDAALYGRGKNMLAMKSTRAVSPTESMVSSCSSSSSRSTGEDWNTLIEEELQRREVFNRRIEGQMCNINKKIKGADASISRIKGEKKSLKAQREALREQLRLLDLQELSLDKRERSAIERKKRYEVIAAKFNKIKKQ